MPENITTPEEQDHIFREAIAHGASLALETIHTRFEEAEDPLDRLSFHDADHTEGVMRRTEAILNAIREVDPGLVAARDTLLGRFAAAFHDTVQAWEAAEQPEGDATKSVRKRLTGENEKASTQEAISTMRELQKQFGPEIFSEDDEQTVQEAIEATIPGFDPTLGTATQPNIRQETSVVARAVAMADLGIAGMEGPAEYQRTGDALFREENLDITRDLASGLPLPPETQERYRRRMLQWAQSQPRFAEGRQALLEKDIAQFPEEVQKALRELFSQFDATIRSAQEQIERRQAMSFAELAAAMGYTLKREQ